MESLEQQDLEFKLVTCPETAHLEMIGYAAHPLGMLLDSCSQFRPPCELACRRTCATLLDRRARTSDPAIELAAPAESDPAESDPAEIDPLASGPLEVGDDTNLGIDLADLRLLLRPAGARG